MTLRLLISTCALLIPLTAHAQTGYALDITGTASSTYSFAATSVQCNVQNLPGVEATINPRYLAWDDPSAPNRFCIHDTGNNTGPLFALPIGQYAISLRATNTVGSDTVSSPPSNTVNFSRLVTPAARTGLRVRGVS